MASHWSTMSAVSLPRQGPRYFSLLWEEELDDLRPILSEVFERRAEVLRRWYELYLVYFGNSRALSETEFFQICGEDLESTLLPLLRKDFDGFVTGVRRVGESLLQRKVPFPEVVASMHLFEESASAAFPGFPRVEPHHYHAFDKLSHCRIIVLADAYFRSHAAAAAGRLRDLEREAAQLPRQARTRFHGLVGAHPTMRRLYERIEAVASTLTTVLIVGESGTGKELVARAIHECGAAPRAPFVALNCAAIPRELIESELFGYKRGAFSGAVGEYIGLFRAAQGGTLLLDEITEMSPDTQSKLLRVSQERTVRPVGSVQEIPVNVRIIASTNQRPEEAVRLGRLREDLYYRLQVNLLEVPPLRERLSDLPLLVEHFIALFNEKFERATPVVEIEPEALAALERYKWPGNVRELSNAIETGFTFSPSPMLGIADLPANIRGDAGTAAGLRAADPPLRPATFAEMERDLVRRALEFTGGNKVKAARLLKISRKKLYAKITKYQIK